ncbi:hypothetical protein TL16_g11657, partial [Triparma laevis f. inornata]
MVTVGDIDLSDKSISTAELSQTFKMYKAVKRVLASRNYIERLPHNTPLTIVNLDLSFNQLTTLNGFDVLVNLKHLNVSHNAINSTWGLYSNNVTPGSNNNKKNKGYNDTLLTLDISHNYIGVIEGLERHKKLEVVNFSNNNLRSYNDVRSLSLNTNLKVANFENNVLATYKNFKFKIIHYMPGVSVIGNKDGHASINSIQQKHLEQVEGTATTASEEGGKGMGGGGRGSTDSNMGDTFSPNHNHSKRGGNNNNNLDDEGQEEGYHQKAQRKFRNVPDERTRRQLTQSASRSSFAVPGSSNRRTSEAFSQFGHGSGSKVTELHAFSGKRKMIAKNEEKERYATKPLPWRQPPAPMPKMTKQASAAMDDAYVQSQSRDRVIKKKAQIASAQHLAQQMSQQSALRHHRQQQNFGREEEPQYDYGDENNEVWWTPSRLKDDMGPNFQPVPNQPDAIRWGHVPRHMERKVKGAQAQGAG